MGSGQQPWLGAFWYEGNSSYEYLKKFEIHPPTLDKIVNHARGISRSDLLRNFDKIYRDPVIREINPGLSRRLIGMMFDAIGRQSLINVIHAYAQVPQDSGTGWPDLTLVKKNVCKFCEVKTTDNLRDTQICTILRFKPAMPHVAFEVIQLIKAK